jgi:hypothetical protein
MKKRPFILVITTLSIAGAAMVSVVASKNLTMAVNATTDSLHVALPDNLKKLPLEQLLPLP